MGTCSSVAGVATKDSPLKPTLKHSTITLVQDSWSLIAGQRERFGVYVYNSFLSREREMRKLFPRLVLEDGRETFRVDEAEVRRHSLLVMDGLGLAVDCLDDVTKLRHFLHIVGVRHNRAGVKSDMLKKLYPAVDEALRVVLGKKCTKKTRHAWKEFFVYITDIMKCAMQKDARESMETKSAMGCPF